VTGPATTRADSDAAQSPSAFIFLGAKPTGARQCRTPNGRRANKKEGEKAKEQANVANLERQCSGGVGGDSGETAKAHVKEANEEGASERVGKEQANEETSKGENKRTSEGRQANEQTSKGRQGASEGKSKGRGQ